MPASGQRPEPEEKRYSVGDEKVTIVTLGHLTHILIKIAIGVLLVLLAVYGIRKAHDFGYSIFTLESASEELPAATQITILEGMSPQDVAALLKEERIIPDEDVFYVQYLIYGYELVPGTYTLSSEQSIEE